MGARISCVDISCVDIDAADVIRVDDRIPLNETVTLPPREILQHIFSMQGVECDPLSLKHCVGELARELTERCQRIDSTDKEYDCFISYRVNADKDVAEKLCDKLKLADLNPFLDKDCLPIGEDFKRNFLKALRGSKFFVALISTAGLAQARNDFIDHSADSLLLEYQIAMEINQKRRQDGSPEFIIPVLVGHVAQVGGNDCLTKFGPSGFALGQYSDSVAAKPKPKSKPEEDAVTSRAVEAVITSPSPSPSRSAGGGGASSAGGAASNAPATLSDDEDWDLYGDDWGPWSYTGEVSNGKRHGSGTCTWHTHPGGGIAVYTGQWQSGRMCGEGELRRPDGNVYKGQLQAGKMHGRGKYTWATGRVYEGEWSEDKIEGRGKMTAADGSIEHDGWWKNDEPVCD